MTPAARIAAAIEILDNVLAPNPVEKTLTNWARSNRYAGSGDRAAIRDHVFDALRCRRSMAWLGGSETGRGLMIGLALANGEDLNALFSGEKYAPATLTEDASTFPDLETAPRAVQLDCPDWLLERFDADLKGNADEILKLMRTRAPVFLRVNLARSDRANAAALLVEDGIVTHEHPLSPSALVVTENPRRISRNPAYLQGFVEMQDAASQAVVDFLPLTREQRILDFCAGGGGKSLAMAARTGSTITAYDALPQRMKDLPERAERAGADVRLATIDDLAGQKFDFVLCDVPCTGSGSWRRSPEAKWELSPERLAELTELQTEILDESLEFVTESGILAYVTCSLFSEENRVQVDRFLDRHRDWKLLRDHQFTPLDGGDGFYAALLTRA